MQNDPYALVAQRVIDGSTLVRRTALKGGVSASVELLELRVPSGETRKVVVRMHSASWKDKGEHAMRTEHALQLALFRARLPVPEPLLVDESCTLLPAPYIAMAYVEGSSHVDADDVDEAVREMATFLARLHALDLAEAALPPLPPGDDPIAAAPGFLRALDVDTATLERALATVQHGPTRATLLHGDYWPGNVLWRDRRIAAVLDWEDAAIGDPLSDVACCRVELACAYDERATETFTRAYAASAHVDERALATWDVYVSAAALSTMAQWGLPADVEAERRARTTAFLERASLHVLAHA